MSWPLYALIPLPTGGGDCSRKWRDWAAAIRRHQARFRADLARYQIGQGGARPSTPAWVPWTLDDLAERRGGRPGFDATSRYYGVSRTPSRQHRSGYLAYIPRTQNAGYKPLGWFLTEFEAACTVLAAINPNAPTPTEETP